MSESHLHRPSRAAQAATPHVGLLNTSHLFPDDLSVTECLEAPADSIPSERGQLQERLLYALADLGCVEILGRLSDLVGGENPDKYSRRRALGVLVRLLGQSGRDPIDVLVGALGDPACEVRERAIEICRDIKDQRIVPHLVARLGDRSEPLQGKAMWAIRSIQCQDPRLLAGVLDLLDDACAPVALRIRALQSLQYPQQGNWALPALLNCIRDLAVAVRIWAGEVFPFLADREEATTRLLEMIQEGPYDKQRHLSLLWALARLGTARAATHLESCLTNSDREFVAVAIHGLGRSGDLKYQPLLLEMLNDLPAAAKMN